MLWGGLLIKTAGAGFLFCCYFGMVLLALSSSSTNQASTITLPASSAGVLSTSAAATRLTHAYLTTMSEESKLPALIALSRSLLAVQSPHRLVVLLPSTFARKHASLKNILAALPNVKVEYVKPVTLPTSLSSDAAHASSFLLLSAFTLTQYRRLLYLPLHSWLTHSLDGVLLSPMPLAFSIAVSASYTPLLCASADSLDQLAALEAADRLDAVPRHFLHPPGSLPFTNSPLLLAPSKAATQQMYAVLERRDGSYHGATCKCDDVTDVLAEWHAEWCTRQEVERQRQADALHTTARAGLTHIAQTFYPHDYCIQRLPLNLSLPVHTHHCLAVPAFRQATPLLSLQPCERQHRLLSSLLPAPAATDLARVQQLTLARTTAATAPAPQPAASKDGLFEPSLFTPAAEREREAADKSERKYGLIYLQEQRAAALERLQRAMDERVKVHGGGAASNEARHLQQCQAVYSLWVEQYYDALSHLRPSQPAVKG